MTPTSQSDARPGRATGAVPLTDAQRGLASSRDAVRVAMALVRRFARAAPRMREEIESAAMYGLVTAALTFDPAMGVKFTTWATWKARGAITDTFRSERPLGYRGTRDRVLVKSLSALIEEGEYDAEDGSREVGWAAEIADGAAAATSPLSDGERAVLLRWCGGMTQEAAVGRAVGRSRAAQIVRASLEKCRGGRATNG